MINVNKKLKFVENLIYYKLINIEKKTIASKSLITFV